MKSPSRYWREAATLILTGRINGITSTIAKTQKHDSPTSAHFDYKTLMLKRSGQSGFFAGMYVFPGGTIDQADFSKEWEPVFENVATRSVRDITAEFKVDGPRPPMITAKRQQPVLPADIGFRICAIRETFEESGILLATKKEDIHSNTITSACILDRQLQAEWRKKVKNDAYQFIELCKNFGVVPNLWALKEWSNWLTPVMRPVKEPPAKPKRYDTMFYICAINDTHQAEHDTEEMTNNEWVTPTEVFDPNTEVKAVGPQLYECSRLANFTSLDSLMKYSEDRQLLGTIRWFNVYIMCTDGYVALMPGDGLYPDNPDEDGTNQPKQVDMSVEELRKESLKWNRQERYANDKQVFLCNIELPCDQVKPYGVQDTPSMISRL